MEGVDLTGANLTEAYLEGVILVDAILIGADLTDANLEGVDLTGADLTDANLEGVDLTGADLTDAVVDLPPVITLLGKKRVKLGVGTEYIDAGATALDADDGDVIVTTSGSVDVNTPGTYTLIYTANDATGNTATITRAVIVIRQEIAGLIEDMQYDALIRSISLDGDKDDWADAEWKGQVPFEKGGELVLFEEYGGGTWSGPEDHSSAVAFAWDEDNLYVGVVVTDDTHQNGGSGWNGDSIQMVFANAAQDTVTHLYNYGLSDGGDVVIHNERGPGGTEASITRDDDGGTTLYEFKFPAESLGQEVFESGMQLGVGLCVNDGDTQDGQGGQRGWSGWGPYAAVYGKTASATGLVTLVDEVLGEETNETLLATGLVAYYPFNGNANDESGNGNDGEVNGVALVEDRFGVAESAYSFAGTREDGQYIDLGKSDMLNLSEDFSICAWVYQVGGAADPRIISYGQDGGVELLVNGGGWDQSNYAMNFGGHRLVAENSYEREKWHFVVGLQSGSTRKLYIDGELEAVDSGQRTGNLWSESMNIGRKSDHHDDWWGGFIDDIRIYKRALNEAEMATLYEYDAVPGGAPVETVPDLIAYWPFDGNLDDAVGDSHGEAMGSDDIVYDDGQFGQGIALDGVDQFVETPMENEEMFDFQDGTGFSISAWFTVDSFNKNWQALIAKGEGNRWRVHRRGGENILTGNGGNGHVPAGGTDVTGGEMHHLVLVSDPDRDEVRLYVDGELESSNTGPAVQSNDNPMMIGENPDARGRTWHGLIDDVGIWARPITEEEVATIWNDGQGTSLLTVSNETPKPRLSSLKANAGGFSFLIKDVEGAEVDAASIVVNYNGAVVEVNKSEKVDGLTTISYEAAEILVFGSAHTLSVALNDTNGNSVKIDREFKVKDYLLIDSTVRVDESNKGESGFLVYPTQISSGQGVGNLHGNNWQNAEKQINGGYIDPDTEEQYLNEADIDAFEGWSYYPEIVEWVNQNQDAPGGVGNFNANNGYEDESLTGIPGWGDSTDGIASEYIALLDLERGAYKLGVNSDDGFHASFGANFGDLLAQTAGIFDGGRGASDTTFEIFIEEAGLYPYRVSWWEGGGGANIEIFSYVDIDGKATKVLINDPDVDGSIKAYTIVGAVVDESTTVRATTGRAKVLSVSPSPGDTLVKSAEISVVIQNEDTTVKQDTVVLSLNGEAVDANVSKDGNIVTISYAPEAGLPVGAHMATISFEESNGINRATDWKLQCAGSVQPFGRCAERADGAYQCSRVSRDWVKRHG